jgi:geranylgeranyl pyrophosphate synthase
MLLHMMRSASPSEQVLARQILDRPRGDKTIADIDYLYTLIHRYGSIDYARALAVRLARKAERILERTYIWMSPSIHRSFLLGMAEHVITRNK